MKNYVAITFGLMIFMVFTACKNETSDRMRLSVETFVDTNDHNYTADEILRNTNWQNEFLINNTISKGYNTKSLWIKINTSSLKNYHYLNINNALLDKLCLYTVRNDRITDSVITGDLAKFNTRRFDLSSFMFSIDSSSDYILLHARTNGMLSLPMEFFKKNDIFYRRQLNSYFFLGLYSLAMIFNLILLLKFREKLYLYFFLVIVSMALAMAADSGLLFQFLWPGIPSINNLIMFFYCLIISLPLFTERFFNIKENMPWLYRIFVFVYISLGALFILSVVGYYNLSIQLYLVYFFLIPPMCILAAIIALRHQRTRYTYFFITAILIYIFFLNLYFLSFTGIVKNSAFIANSVQYANISEIVFLFLAVTDRFQQNEKEKITAERKLVEALKKNEDILQQQNNMLEDRVKNRTREIEDLNVNITRMIGELITKNEELTLKNKLLSNQKEELNTTLMQLKVMQEHLIQTEKMAALGILTAGIAHEINNPVNYVSSTAQALEDLLSDLVTIEKAYARLTPENASEELEKISQLKEKIHFDKSIELMPATIKSLKTGVKRTVDIVRGLRQYTSQDAMEKKPANINELLESS